MKHFLFVAVAVGIFSVATITVKGQPNINIERFGNRDKPKISMKFIEGIEIVPGESSHITSELVPDEKGNSSQPTQVAITKQAIVKPGFAGNIENCSSLQFKYGMMMDREVESITNFSLYNFIDHWWGIRYQYGGSDSNGIDCSAFTSKLLSEVYGITAPRTANDQYNICRKLATEDLAEGDLVFFNTSGGVSHVGLYLGNNYFVHSSSGGVTISSLADDYYSRKFISGGRMK